MKHPRRLLALPLLLLGVWLFVLARAPRPHTALDAEIWSQSGSTLPIHIMFNEHDAAAMKAISPARVGLPSGSVLTVADRASIRSILHAFQDMQPIPRTWEAFQPQPDARAILLIACTIPVAAHAYSGSHWVLATSHGGYILVRNWQNYAVVDAASVARLLNALRSASSRAKQREEGYKLRDQTEPFDFPSDAERTRLHSR